MPTTIVCMSHKCKYKCRYDFTGSEGACIADFPYSVSAHLYIVPLLVSFVIINCNYKY